MAEAFISTVPKDMVVNHKDGNSLNNNLDNLEIITQQENVKEVKERIKRQWKRCIYRLINTETNEEIDFNSSTELAEHLKLSSASVRNYANEVWKGLAKGIYKIIKIEK